MPIQRSIAFVDGENLVMRFQAMTDAGAIPLEGALHERDTFLWHRGITECSMFDFIRINYYTSTTGDLPKVDSLKDTICGVEYSFSYTHDSDAPNGSANLVPHVFHKPSRNTKARNVDLQISIDVLRAAHLQSVDVIFLLSGDGDYVPLIQEASRHGKEIWLAAFSSGLHPKLRHHADVFFPLDEIFFQPKSTST